jgi:uncharacterized protein YccT (UPF0319 family)
MDVSQYVEKYLALKDKISELEEAHKVKLAPMKEMLTKIENAIMAELNRLGADSMKTPAGTAYKSSFVSVSVADRSMFMEFLQSADLWHMLDVKANKTAVKEYRAANGDLPPGINYREEVTVNIRRS